MFKKAVFIFLIVVPIIALVAVSATKEKNVPSNPSKIENFSLPDVNGNKHSLKEFKDSKAIVVMFIATQCPISNAYNKRMAKLYNKYKEKNIAFIGINSNKQEGIEEIKNHAEENSLNFTILKDDKNKIADMFEASFTPEIYVLNSSTYEILYHGRIDDSRDESKVENTDLSNALDELLAGKKITVAKTKAFGCTIKRI
jgi:peroxiredoxin